MTDAGGAYSSTGPGFVSPRRASVLVAFAAVYVVWGSTYLAIRVMDETVPPVLGAAVRFLVAGSLLAAIVWMRGPRTFVHWSHRQWGAVVTTSMLLVVGGPGLTTVAEDGVRSGLAALLVASVPLWVVGWRLIAREPMGRSSILASAAGLTGVAVLVWPSRTDVGGSAPSGVVLLLVVALSYSAGSFLSPRLGLPTNVFAVSAAQMVLAALVMGVYSVPAGAWRGFDVADVSWRSWIALLYLIGPGSLIAYTAYVWLLARQPVGRVTSYAYVNPVVAVALGALVLAEPITPRIGLGAVIIVVAVSLVVTAPNKMK